MGLQCGQESGAKLFMQPQDAPAVTKHLEEHGVQFPDGHALSFGQLKPRHVVIELSMHIAILTWLQTSPGSGKDGGACKDKMKVRRRAQISCDTQPTSQADSGLDAARPSPR